MSLVTAKYAQKVRFTHFVDGSPVSKEFELDNMQFGFPEIAEEYEFFDYSKEKVIIGYRFVANFDSRYLRAATDGSEFTNIVNNQNSVTFRIEGIGMTAVAVNITPLANTISINNQRITPAYGFTVEAKEKVSAVPSWFKFTKAKPGYL